MRPPRALPQAKLGATNVIVFMFMTTKSANVRRVLLTPLRIEAAEGDVVCVAVRNPVSQEIIALTLSAHDLSEKADIPLLRAQEIFEAALRADDHTRS